MEGEAAQASERPPLGAVFLVAFGVLAYEVAITRVFSVVLAHHYVFLAVSIAVCGLGLGGLGLHVARARRGPGLGGGGDVLAASAAGFALGALAVLGLLLGWLLPQRLDLIWLAGLLLLAPFTCAGVFLAEVFGRFGRRAGGVYAADLLGSATAAVAVVALLHLVGGSGACAVGALAAGLGGALASSTRGGRRLGLAAAAVALAALGGDRAFGLLSVRAVRLAEDAPGRDLAKPLFLDLALPLGERPIVLESDWNAFARTDLVLNPGFGTYANDIYQVFTNGHVPTYMMRAEGDLRGVDLTVEPWRRIPAWGHLSANSLLTFRRGPFERVLCIGPGGGADVLLALAHGARQVDGPELNGSILELMDEHAAFNGHLYEREDVDVVTAEGRSWLRRAPHRYDLIYAALTQTATTSGAALLENYVYTREAFRDYWEHLTDDGLLALIVHDQTLLLRLFVTAMDLLEREGVAAPRAIDHLAMLHDPSSPYAFLLLLSRAPWERAEIEALGRDATELETQALFLPGLLDSFLGPMRAGEQTVEQFAALVRPFDESTGKAIAVDLSPCSDDRPFFFDVFGGVPADLRALCAGAAVLVLLFSLAAVFLRGAGAASHAQVLPFGLHFAAIGAGFMLIEIPLIQKLVLALGYPTLALSTTLFAILLGGGIGSWASPRVAARLGGDGRAVRAAALAAAGLAVAFALALPVLDLALLRQPLWLRVGEVAVALGLLGLCLGVPFPAAVRLLAARSPSDVPWMWGVNGVMSVVGSLLAVILATELGFRAVLLGGAAVYVGVALLARWLEPRP